MILIAEDNEVLRDMLIRQLQRLGYQVIAVPCGGKAVEEVLNNPVNLVLMDVEMPNVDGLEATKRIRQIERSQGRPPVPIIAISAAANKDACLSAGMDDHYEKPILISDLDELISKWRRKAG